jgi:hypothetical protein
MNATNVLTFSKFAAACGALIVLATAASAQTVRDIAPLKATTVAPIQTTKLLPPPVPNGVRYDSRQVGQNRAGSDYRSFDIAPPAATAGFAAQDLAGQCAQQCQSESQCKAWTLTKPGVIGTNARCWLKSSIPAINADSNQTSGVVLRASQSDVDMPGFDIKVTYSQSTDECVKVCSQTSGCLAWSFNNKVCRVKNEVSMPVQKSGYSSGRVQINPN